MEYPDTTTNSDTAETETFSDSESDLEQQNFSCKCKICSLKCFESVDYTVSVQLIKNIIWLTCESCGSFFHMSCLETQFTIDDLLYFIEQSYMCSTCQKKQ